ncbi:MAG: response regulator [Candidatus Latescibacteria bacterium]|nr:response regulator [Candidatus Latescibacterota bacterium]
METIKMHTDFAPAERASAGDLERQRQLFRGSSLMTQILDSVPNIVLVLNQERQIVYANQNLYDTLQVKPEEIELVFGSRPGEVWKCVHAFESVGGCGTTEFCETCGAAQAILASQEQRSDVQECRIIQDGTGDALDLRVWAKPLVLGDELFSIFTVVDISHEKRREVLERIFFHDLLNTAGGLRGSAELFNDASQEELNEFQDIILKLSDELIEEIQAQRQLVAAEKETLATYPSVFDTADVLHEIVHLYSGHHVSQGRQIKIVDTGFNGSITTDRTLLRRVLGNMTKNALEATKRGEEVRLGCEETDGGIVFTVHNPGFIPEDVQHQIFQRSFSTKGPGRGLGTYSIKLLTEQYLNGRVSFTTSPALGTVFQAFCPHLVLEQETGLMDILPPENRESVSLHILVAEDNPVNQKLATRLLERLGHTTVAVGTGKEALQVLVDEAFDLVLMDCQMPEMDGFEATQKIRQSGEVCNADIPIVAMTGNVGKEDREACLAVGMNDHIPKPVGKDGLIAMLARWSNR